MIKPAVDRISGRMLTCGAGTVSASTRPPIPPVFTLLCPPGVCSYVRWRGDLECLTDPLKCRRTIPVCDPRCARIDCCGGPLPPIDQPGVILGWAEGGKVLAVSGVEILPHNSKRYVPLTRGRILRAGDILRIQPGAQLNLKTRYATFKTAPEGMPAQTLQTVVTKQTVTKQEERPWIFLVTGPSALKLAPKTLRPSRVASRTQLKRILGQDWQRYGEAGPPPKRPTRGAIDPDRMAGRVKKPQPKER